MSPELPFGQSRPETVDRTGHSIPGEFFTTKSMLADYIPYEESIYDTTSKTSGGKVILNSGFLTPTFPTEEQAIESPSSEEEDTLSVLPSALSPRPTESTDTPFLIELVKQDETKAVPTAAHTEKSSLQGFETESPSGQGKS